MLPSMPLPSAPPLGQPLATSAQAIDPVAALQAVQAAGGREPGGTAPDPKVRPEVPQHVKLQVDDWFKTTDNLVQRGNALWEYREANKTLFPARFNPNDPRRGQVPHEIRNGRDNRRVQTPYIYRDTLQTTAMAVPEDLTFKWNTKPQVQAPETSPLPPAMMGQLPPAMQLNEHAKRFAETLEIVEQTLLEEADWIPRIQAAVQDGSTFPLAIIKHSFHRDYQSSPVSQTPLSHDASATVARLESLMRQYASKVFDKNSSQYANMLDLLTSLKDKAALTRFYGLEIQLIPMDAFGICEDVADLVDVYDTPWMFHDALIVGEEILAKYPYGEGEDGNTYGVLETELNEAVPWDTVGGTSTDPNARNRASRNRQLTAPRATSINAVATTSASTTNPKQRKYVVREVWSKKTRTVYTMIRGIKHYLSVFTPKNKSERWYPFKLYAPNRVPTEVYGVSDLELKRDIQARIHRKRTDEEKGRSLSIDRYVYNTSLVDSREAVKLGDIPPGQFRGINFGNGMKPSDALMPLKINFTPESYDTSRDERDKDMMGALPSQALGATGTANFATEVSVASQGAAVAVQHRQNIIRRFIDGMLTDIAEELVQEMTLDEVQVIAGPFAFWPTVYDDSEAQKILDEAKQRAMQNVAPTVMQATVQDLQNGIPIDPNAVQAALEAQAVPIWQQEMVSKYGNIEPISRESLFRRLKIKVKSSLMSSMDRQQRIQSMAQLSGAVLQLAQVAQATGQPFNPRPLLRNFSLLADDDDCIDEMFPGVPTLALAANQAQQAGAAAGSTPAGQMTLPGAPQAQGGAGQTADDTRQPPGQDQQQSPGTPTPDKQALSG